MKTRQSRRQIAKVSNSRWVAYATAGAATALAGSNSLEAAIHYSGLVKEGFPPDSNKIKSFQLDQPGDFFQFEHAASAYGFAGFGIFGGSAQFRGVYPGDYCYVSKLSRGQSIAAGPFASLSFGTMAFGHFVGFQQWTDPGVGFVGFKFNSGAGIQYGWARVRMGGTSRNNAFKLLDYAYADPGEAIRAGQGIRAGEDGQDMSDEQGLDEGSLGGLAVGAVGLLAWRKNRSRIAS